MISTRKRFQGREAEILAMTKVYGQASTETQEGISNIAFRKWLKGVSGDENYGLAPRIYPTHIPEHKSGLDFVLEKLEDRVFALKTRIAEKDKKIAFLENQLTMFKIPQETTLDAHLVHILEACEELR